MKALNLSSYLCLTGIVTVLASQPAYAQVAQVTGVDLTPTATGLEILLQTTTGAATLVQTTQTEQGLVAEISNAQLSLPSGKTFRQENPTEQISAVTVRPLDQNRIQVLVTGTAGVPTGQVFVRGAQGLVVNVTPSAEPAPAAEKPTEPEPTASDLDPIELVVTATRTEEDPEDISRTVTVINREQIQEQTNISRNLSEILGKLVPGFGPPTQSLSIFGQSLRGRDTSVLIDGVPQSTTRNVFRDLQTIDPGAIERIEVLRGPTAIYGSEATGGVINIITRKPEKEFTATTEAGLDLSLSDPGDSLGGNIQQFLSGRQDNFDYTISAGYDRTGAFFDAQGDRIPPDPNGQGGISESNAYDILGKFGVDLDEDQRLQLTFNRFEIEQDTDFTTDPSIEDIEGRQKARAIEGLVLETPQGSKNTLLNLEYSHKNFFGSQLKGQIYYRDYFSQFFPSDRRTDPRRPFIFQSRLESEKFGGRFQAETPLFDQAVTLLTGIDYTNETTSQPVNIFDSEALDASGGLVFQKIEERTWVPPLDQNSLGLFAQANWDVTEQLILSGGIRHERIGFSADDFTTLGGNFVEGGNLNYNATLFNAGAVYKATEAISLFANFSQGFSTADIGLVLRDAPAGFSVESLRPEAQRVNSYEAGVRGNWNQVQASVVGFYNTSNLGTSFNLSTFDVIRAPERVYGIEAAVDAQPAEGWQVGTSLTWLEGENDPDDNGEFVPLNGFRIFPLKLTAYVENETLPGWKNRLQALYVGGRDRAFEAEVDSVGVNSYVTLDYVSSLQVGPGTLSFGVGNLLDTQYFPVISQVRSEFDETTYSAGRGRTLNVNYRFTW